MNRPLRRFLFKLASHLHMTVGQIEQTMSSAELSEWIAFFRVEPTPDAHWSAAQICAVIANTMGGGGKIYKVDDFLPRPVRVARRAGSAAPIDIDRPTPEQSAGIIGRRFKENHEAAVQRIAAMRG